MTPEMIETARLLAAHPKCPEGLVQAAAGVEPRCQACGNDVGDRRHRHRCPICRAGGRWCRDEPVDFVPDLTSDANGGVLLVAIGAHYGFEGEDDSTRMWSVSAQQGETATKHLAHAAALELLGRRP